MKSWLVGFVAGFAALVGGSAGALAGPITPYTATYQLAGLGLATTTNQSTANAGSLSGTFTLSVTGSSVTLLSADIVANVTAPAIGCTPTPGNQCNVYDYEYIYGLPGANSAGTASYGGTTTVTLTANGISPTQKIELAWAAGNLSALGISSFDLTHTYSSYKGNVYAVTGSKATAVAAPEPGSLALFGVAIAGLTGVGIRRRLIL